MSWVASIQFTVNFVSLLIFRSYLPTVAELQNSGALGTPLWVCRGLVVKKKSKLNELWQDPTDWTFNTNVNEITVDNSNHLACQILSVMLCDVKWSARHISCVIGSANVYSYCIEHRFHRYSLGCELRLVMAISCRPPGVLVFLCLIHRVVAICSKIPLSLPANNLASHFLEYLLVCMLLDFIDVCAV